MTAISHELDDLVRLDEPSFYTDNPFPVYSRLRREAPMYWYERGQCWILSRYADVKTVSGDDNLFSAQYGFATYDNFNVSGRLRKANNFEVADQLDNGEISAHEARRILKTVSEGAGSKSMVLSDPPLHTELRRMTNPRIVRRSAEALVEEIRAITIAALDEIPDGEPVDLVSALAKPVPLAVIARLMGIPKSDWAEFGRWSDSMIEIIDATEPTRIAELQVDLETARAYFRHELEDRLANPQDDMLSDIANGTAGGDRLELPAQVRYATLMLSAGNETTRNLFSGGIKALMDFPDQMELLLSDESLLPRAVDEMLRWTTPVNATGRTAMEPTEIHGVEVAVGDYLVMLYPSANRDEEAWERADEFDVGRKATPMHQAFGTGQHICIGQHVARLEAMVMFEETLKRFPSIIPAGEPTYAQSTHVQGLATLPVIFSSSRS